MYINVNDLKHIIGKVVVFKKGAYYLITDIFRLCPKWPRWCVGRVVYGVALVNVNTEDVFVSKIVFAVTENGKLVGIGIDSQYNLSYGDYLFYNLRVNKDRIYRIDRFSMISRFIKKYSANLMRNLYHNEKELFTKLPPYRRFMRDLIFDYLNPDKCILQHGV